MALPDAWLELVADLLESPRPLPTERVATILIDSFSLTGCAFNDERPVPGRVYLWPSDSEFSEVGRDIEDWTSAYGSWEHPLLVFYEHTRSARPAHLADVPEDVVPRATMAAWIDFAGSKDHSHQMLVPLGRREHHARAFALVRPDPFTPQEQRQIETLWRTLRVLDSTGTAAVGIDLPACRDAGLTGREASVLGLLAEGLSARLAARRLGVAERTVHKHQERLYAKLGVHDRVNAVERARVRGLLGSPSHRAVEIDPPATDRNSGRA